MADLYYSARRLDGSDISKTLVHPDVGRFALGEDGEFHRDGFGTISMITHKKNGDVKIRVSEGGCDATYGPYDRVTLRGED